LDCSPLNLLGAFLSEACEYLIILLLVYQPGKQTPTRGTNDFIQSFLLLGKIVGHHDSFSCLPCVFFRVPILGQGTGNSPFHLHHIKLHFEWIKTKI
jgi:hypothetical protein